MHLIEQDRGRGLRRFAVIVTCTTLFVLAARGHTDVQPAPQPPGQIVVVTDSR